MPTPREQAHAEVHAQILDAARAQLAETGAAGLSLRAVAREVGLVSSAVYRYVANRDDLLTALILDAYTSLGAAATAADKRVRRDDLPGRWLAVTRVVRRWALAHRHEWALLFGTPVPGYRAPADTVDPALVVPYLLVGIVPDRPAAQGIPSPPKAVAKDLRGIAGQLGSTVSEQQTARAVMAWTLVVGAVSFELFGHLENGIHEYDGWYDHQMRLLAHDLGLGA